MVLASGRPGIEEPQRPGIRGCEESQGQGVAPAWCEALSLISELFTFAPKAETASARVQHLSMVERYYSRIFSIKYLESRLLALEKIRYILDLEAVLI